MKKFWKYIMITAAAVALMPLTACDDDDTVDPYDVNLCYVYQPNSTFAKLEYKHNGEFLIDINDPLKLMPVRVTKPAPKDLTVTIGIDPSLVDLYNQANGTDYVLLEGASVVTPQLTIEAGKYVSSDSIVVTFDHEKFKDGNTNYILPVAIQSAPGVTVSRSNVIYLTFTSTYRPNLISTIGQRNLSITNDTDIDGWETANRNVTINNFISASWAADEAITVTLSIDPNLIDGYNSKNGTNFKPLQATVPSTLVIEKGQTSANLSMTLGDYTGVANGEEYLIPVRLSVDPNTGGGLTESSEIAYIQVIQLPLSLTAKSNEPTNLSMIQPKQEWSGIAHTVNYGDEDMSYILQNNQNYYAAELGDQWVIDLGSIVDVQAFGFEFYYWYYGCDEITEVETSLDGNSWTSWGNATNTTANAIHILFSKPAKFRYLRFKIGQELFSGYGIYVKQLKFYN